MPDASPSIATFIVLGGPLDRQRLDTDEAVDEILIGSDTDCRFCLDAPGVSPIHARIWMDLDGVTVHDTHSPRGVYVNDDRVAGQAPLRDRDILWLGPPGAEGSVMIECRFASPAMQDAAGSDAEPAGPDETILDLVAPPAAAAAGPAESGDANALADLMTEEGPGEAAADAGSAQIQDLLAPSSAPPAPPAPEAAVEFFMDDEVAPAPEPAPPPPAAESSAFDELLVVEPAAPAVSAPPVAEAAQDEFFVDDAAAPASSEPEPPVDAFFVEEAPAALIYDEPFPLGEPAAPAAAAALPPPIPPRQPPPPAAAAPPAAGPAIPPAAPARPSAAPAPPARPPAPPAAAPPPAAASPRAPEPRRAPPSPRPQPASTPPPSRAARTSAATSRGGLPAMAKYGALAAAVLLVLGGVAFMLSRSRSAPKLEAVNPARVAAGQVLTLTGQNFAPDPQGNTVRFEGGRSARVVKASASELQVEVPDLAVAAGKPGAVAVTVSVGGRDSAPLQVTVFQTPRIHGVSPSVAMPGEEVTLAGTGWGMTAKVRFGSAEAPVVGSTATTLRVRVPDAAGAVGASVPVVVAMGSDTSNAFPFLVGRLPLVTGIEPKTVSAGDVVSIAGRGFQLQPASNAVKIGGAPALVVSSSDVEVRAIVPRGAASGPEAPVEVKVAGLDNAAHATLTVSPPLDPVEFSFAAEPWVDAAGHEHAVLTTGLGPAFVLSATGKLSAAERAAEAQRRLSAAAVTLRAARGEDLEVRGVDADPVIVLMGKSDAILEVTEEDAAAYNEDWTKLGGRGGPVTRGRLALWWGAVARDLVLMLVRGESPRHAAGLAPEGKVFVDLFEAARGTGRFGVPAEVVAGARPATREALRIAGLRVPAAVAGPPAPGTVVVPEAGAPGLKLAGVWSGEENDTEGRKFVTVRFAGNAGTLSYQRALSVSVPLTAVEQSRRGEVRYSVKMATGTRFYVGRWDGEKIAGRIFSDAAGTSAIGSFDISPER